MRGLYATGLAYVLLALGLAAGEATARLFESPHEAPAHGPGASAATSDRGWFLRIKPRCNPVEVAVAIKQDPPPRGRGGSAYAAACHALAGKISAARALIDALPEQDRSYAAGVVFEIGHPAADAGDDEAAGPIMELVVQYQPDNYMALYHAGMSEFILGQHALSKRNLERFLAIYARKDGWRRNAESVLARLADSASS